jgi:hypothetical protein
MAWTAPITFVSNTVLTASQLNTYLRDNMLETLPARATTPGGFFVVHGKNQIAEQLPVSAFVPTDESTSETAYTDLATGGPAVTVNTGTAALVMLNTHCQQSNSTAAWMSYEVGGATSSDAQDNRAVMLQNSSPQRSGMAILHEELTPGSNTFTAKYRMTGTTGTASFQSRRIAVLPL